MITEDKNISEAGFGVGYNDLSYFSKIFKRIEGVTPSDYRRTFVENDLSETIP
jgi:AraC-like DNA-binding protein